MMKALLILTMMISPIIAINISEDITRPLTEHPLHLGWLCHSAIGVTGVILNSLVILILYLERSSLISSINVMIMSVGPSFSDLSYQFHSKYSGAELCLENILLLQKIYFDSDFGILG